MESGSSKNVMCLKCYNTPKWESRFTLGLNAAKNIDYNEKWFKQKSRKIKFLTKNSVEAYLYLPQEYWGLRRCATFEML